MLSSTGCALLALVLRGELGSRRALTHGYLDHDGRLRQRRMAWSVIAEYAFVHFPTQVRDRVCAAGRMPHLLTFLQLEFAGWHQDFSIHRPMGLVVCPCLGRADSVARHFTLLSASGCKPHGMSTGRELLLRCTCARHWCTDVCKSLVVESG